MIHLTLLHTNDLHGRVHQLARIATLVRKIRADVQAKDGYCYYFDAGDSEDTTLLESCLTRGSAMDTLLRAAGCDQCALGNAIPIRYGHQAIENLAVSFQKPILCANFFDSNAILAKGLKPYVLENIGGIKIAIIGFTDPMNAYNSIFGLKVQNPNEMMPDLLAKVRAEGAKIVIVLSHCSSKNDIDLAQAISGIDVIIGGHDHQQISPPKLVNGTIIVQSGEYGDMLGRLDLVVDPSTGSIIEHKGQLIPIGEEIPQHEQVLFTLEGEKERASKIMQTEIGELLDPVECFEDRECSAGNLLADALLAHVEGAQAAFVINGHWTSGLAAGKITQGELYIANRSAGNPARINLTGVQIKQFLVNALKPENIEKKLHPMRGRMTGWPHVAGMVVKVEKEHPEELEIFVQGERIKPDDELVVAASDMEFSEILGYLPIPDNQIRYEVPTILPEVLEEYIKNYSPFMCDTAKRFQFS